MKKPETGDGAPEPDLRSIAALRTRTSAVHTTAERSGIISDLLNRRATREGFALFLRNLVPAYGALERSLAFRAASTPVDLIYRPEIARLAALEHDVAGLAGPGWRDLPLAPAALDYADRIETAALGNADLLVAHAYVRYFGDLAGGQILKRLIGETFDLAPDDLRFYAFDRIADLDHFRQGYRASFDRAMRAVSAPEAVLAEAVVAFEFNISVSNEVRTLAARPVSAN